MTAAPEDRIREHLERKGGSTRVSVGRLLGTWGLADDPSDTNRLLVARALEEVGVIARPPLDTTPLEADVELLIADPGARTATRRLRESTPSNTPPNTPSSANLPAPSHGDIRARPAGGPVPSVLPRALLAVGASGTIGSLFLPWFSAERGGEEIPGLSTGWEWLTITDGLLLAVGLAALALLLLRVAGELPALVVAGLAIIAAACVTYRIVAPPGGKHELIVLDVSREVGPFAALLFLGLVVAGAGLLAPSRASGNPVRTGAGAATGPDAS